MLEKDNSGRDLSREDPEPSGVSGVELHSILLFCGEAAHRTSAVGSSNINRYC